MPGAPDAAYVAARRVLLDVLEAVTAHLDALVLVGAQAVYIHAGDADLAVAPYTTDGDLAVNPRRLGPEPLLEKVLSDAGFALEHDVVGIWERSVEVGGTLRRVAVDFLVPDSLGGGGRRGARIPPHDRLVARKVVGLEAALVDNDRSVIASFEAGDTRQFELAVAGPAGLLVAKVHKISERLEKPDRVNDKDALDVYRLLRAISTQDMVRRLRLTESNALSRQATQRALALMPSLFGSNRAPGCAMAVRAAGPLEDAAILAASLIALAEDVLRAL